MARTNGYSSVTFELGSEDSIEQLPGNDGPSGMVYVSLAGSACVTLSILTPSPSHADALVAALKACQPVQEATDAR